MQRKHNGPQRIQVRILWRGALALETAPYQKRMGGTRNPRRNIAAR